MVVVDDMTVLSRRCCVAMAVVDDVTIVDVVVAMAVVNDVTIVDVNGQTQRRHPHLSRAG